MRRTSAKKTTAKRTGAFRLGDIRGIYPDDIDEAFAEDFAHAFVGQFNLKGKIAIGRDMRASSASLQDALSATLVSIGMDVIDMGLCPTELGYFASGQPGIEAAIIVTASHNPARYNGFKCVLRNGQAITHDLGLRDVQALMQGGYRHKPARQQKNHQQKKHQQKTHPQKTRQQKAHPQKRRGSLQREDFHSRYLDFLRQQFPPESLHGQQLALNGLNGTASTLASRIAGELNLPVTWFRETPGSIPAQGADPTNPKLTEEMRGFMAGKGFTLGIAWDGDCDRCVCFDGEGRLIPAYYLIGLLVDHFLARSPGSAIVFDTKLCWNTLNIINRRGGKAVFSETGHAFMKQKMREHKAIYGGELSSHHYFGDFLGCDSGMFAWLTVLQLLKAQPVPLHELVLAQKSEVCCTPEINLKLTDADAAFAEVLRHYGEKAVEVEHFDGLAFSMPGDWRFSLRRSKTEPVVRLNFEARLKRNSGQEVLLAEGTEVLAFLETWRGDESDWQSDFYIH